MPSGFSNVDAAVSAERLVERLDEFAQGQAAMKHYMAVAHALRKPDRPVLDLGCGGGHDLAILGALGVPSVGVDPSATMLDAARKRSPYPLIRASGDRLPLRDHCVDGCRIERVLMHVTDPAAVIRETVRCVVPGGLLTVFEPDWSSLRVNGTHPPTEWVSSARHPAIGAAVRELLHAHGCTVLDRVEEHSSWDLPTFKRVTNIDDGLARAVSSGAVSRSAVMAWLAEQERRAAVGDFAAELTKILWVATTPL